MKITCQLRLPTHAHSHKPFLALPSDVAVGVTLKMGDLAPGQSSKPVTWLFSWAPATVEPPARTSAATAAAEKRRLQGQEEEGVSSISSISDDGGQSSRSSRRRGMQAAATDDYFARNILSAAALALGVPVSSGAVTYVATTSVSRSTVAVGLTFNLPLNRSRSETARRLQVSSLLSRHGATRRLYAGSVTGGMPHTSPETECRCGMHIQSHSPAVHTYFHTYQDNLGISLDPSFVSAYNVTATTSQVLSPEPPQQPNSAPFDPPPLAPFPPTTPPHPPLPAPPFNTPTRKPNPPSPPAAVVLDYQANCDLVSLGSSLVVVVIITAVPV